MRPFLRPLGLLGSAILFALAGCAAPPQTAQPEAAAPEPRELETATAQPSTGHPLAPYGLPRLITGFDHPDTTLVERDGWIALHSSDELIPLWVCHRLDATDTLGDADRDGCGWKSDPLLDPDSPTATDSDYRNSGYARGHQAPANDYSFSQTEICETFFFSNCAPQVQNGFNSGIWSSLEARCQDAAIARGSVFIITGPLFYDPIDDEESPLHDAELDDDNVLFDTIGAHGVAVPTHFFKLVVDTSQESAPFVIAFVLENRRHTLADDGPRFTDAHTRPVRWIEDRTGIDFLPLLSDLGLDPDAFETQPGSLSLWPEFAVSN